MSFIDNSIAEIRNLEDKYGLIPFRMGLTHLVDVGHRNLTDEDVEEAFRQIIAEGESDNENGIKTFLTPEFKCELVRCAAELAKFSIWDLFAYIKDHVTIGN